MPAERVKEFRLEQRTAANVLQNKKIERKEIKLGKHNCPFLTITDIILKNAWAKIKDFYLKIWLWLSQHFL